MEKKGLEEGDKANRLQLNFHSKTFDRNQKLIKVSSAGDSLHIKHNKQFTSNMQSECHNPPSLLTPSLPN